MRRYWSFYNHSIAQMRDVIYASISEKLFMLTVGRCAEGWHWGLTAWFDTVAQILLFSPT